jgi:hypothetical protein
MSCQITIQGERKIVDSIQRLASNTAVMADSSGVCSSNPAMIRQEFIKNRVTNINEG